MRYDLLTEPWLRVRDESGVKKVGLVDLFANATKYRDVVGLPQLETSQFEVYRFLINVYMDACREDLGSNEEVFDQYFNDGFDMEKMGRYFKACEDEGRPFDLLDKERPFLQSSKELLEYYKSMEKDAKEESVACVCNHIPTGNTVPFYGYVPSDYGKPASERQEDTHHIPLDEYAYWLIDKCTWLMGSGGRINAPVSGAATMVLVKGRNVFETIVLNTPAVPMDAEKPMWRWDGHYLGKVDVMCMMSPSRGYYPVLGSVDEEKKTISRVVSFELKKLFDKDGTVARYNEMKEIYRKSYDPNIVLCRGKNDEVFQARFGNERRGLFRVMEALGVVSEGVGKEEDIGKAVYSRVVELYSERARSANGRIEEATVAIYSSDCKQSYIKWSMMVDGHGFKFWSVLGNRRASIFAYNFAKVMRQVGDALRKPGYLLASAKFDDEMSLLFEKCLKMVQDGTPIEEAEEFARKETYKVALNSFERLKNFYGRSKAGGGKGLVAYAKAKVEFCKKLAKLLPSKEAEPK